ncbi:MAG TPA: Fic family protein [Streptosporangiaceae bacterium]|nr:Fic family protein [Streptosporangiaceae bacterium]
MAKVIRKHWVSDVSTGIARRDRRSCDYEAYLPDTLADREIVLSSEAAADVADAERAIAVLDAQAKTLVDTETLARILLRAESVASSRIEGLEVGARRLLRAEAAVELGEEPSDVTAAEVLGNIDAMATAIRSISPGEPITMNLLLDFHHRLLSGTRLEAHAGAIRVEQNWIGGSSYNPCSAAFVPPPPEHVTDLLDDLCHFCNTDQIPAVAQAAIAHAQFETIHPFVDGNGRTGRALIQLVLRRRGLATRVMPPVSLVLATWADDYVLGLDATRYRGPATSTTARDGINLWIGRFAAACGQAVADAASFEESAVQLQETWRARLGPVRANSAADVLLRTLPGMPIMTVPSAARLIDRSFTAVNGGMAKLCEAGIVRQVNVGRRNRAFEAPEVIDAFTALERQLASLGRAGAGGSGASRPRSRQVNAARAEGPSTARSLRLGPRGRWAGRSA